MKVNRTVYELTSEEIKEHPLITNDENQIGFYAWLRKKLDVKDEFDMDCRGIHVAENIQESWIQFAKGIGHDMADINMTLLFYGPMADEKLSDNEICIYDDFLVKSKGEEN